MPDALRRAIRTFIQAFLGSIITSGVLSITATSGVVDWSSFKKTGISAAAAAIVAFITWAQNALEDKGVIPAVLKAPSSGSHEHGHVDLRTAVMCLVISLAVVLIVIAVLDIPHT